MLAFQMCRPKSLNNTSISLVTLSCAVREGFSLLGTSHASNTVESVSVLVSHVFSQRGADIFNGPNLK